MSQHKRKNDTAITPGNGAFVPAALSTPVSAHCSLTAGAAFAYSLQINHRLNLGFMLYQATKELKQCFYDYVLLFVFVELICRRK